MRIVSLLPAATEWVCALGFSEALVGRSHECDFPEGLDHLPVCTESMLKPKPDSAAIHADVTALVRDALAVYRVKTDVLRRLQPTHIITQDQCSVCAVDQAQVCRAIEEVLEQPCALLSLAPATLGDVYDDALKVGTWLQCPDQGRALRRQLWAATTHINTQIRGTSPLKVVTIEWMEPLMSSGNWVPEMVRLAGGQSMFGEEGRHSPWISWDDVVAAQPEVLLIKPCGFGLEQTKAEMPTLKARPNWASLPAVKNGRVYLADGNHFFNRSGPRLVESVEMLGEILHPERCEARHGRWWCRMD